MSKHSQIVSDISKQSSFSAKKEDERLLLASSLMHAADISNPIMPWEVSKSLAERCCVEFGMSVKQRCRKRIIVKRCYLTAAQLTRAAYHPLPQLNK